MGNWSEAGGDVTTRRQVRGGHRLEGIGDAPTPPVDVFPGYVHTPSARGRRSQALLPHRYRSSVLFQHAHTADSRQSRRSTIFDSVIQKFRMAGAINQAPITETSALWALVHRTWDVVPRAWDIAPRGVGRCPTGAGHCTTERGTLPHGRGTLHHGAWDIAPRARDIAPRSVGHCTTERGTLPHGRGTLPHGRGALPHGARDVAPRAWDIASRSVGHCTMAAARVSAGAGTPRRSGNTRSRRSILPTRRPAEDWPSCATLVKRPE
jgi:hypothetical protein